MSSEQLSTTQPTPAPAIGIDYELIARVFNEGASGALITLSVLSFIAWRVIKGVREPLRMGIAELHRYLETHTVATSQIVANTSQVLEELKLDRQRALQILADLEKLKCDTKEITQHLAKIESAIRELV